MMRLLRSSAQKSCTKIVVMNTEAGPVAMEGQKAAFPLYGRFLCLGIGCVACMATGTYPAS